MFYLPRYYNAILFLQIPWRISRHQLIICIPASQDAPIETKVYLYMASHKHTIANTAADEEIDLNNAIAIGAVLA